MISNFEKDTLEYEFILNDFAFVKIQMPIRNVYGKL